LSAVSSGVVSSEEQDDECVTLGREDPPLFLSDKRRRRLQQQPPPAISMDPPRIFHIVYTSGTTGKPKGCISSIQSLQHYLQVKNEVYGLEVIRQDDNETTVPVVLLASALSFDPCLHSFEEAVRVRKGALGRDHPQVVVSLVKVEITLLLLTRLEDSLWIFREALTVRKHAMEDLHPSTARIYNNIGCVHVEFQELKEARGAFEAALDIQRNALVHEPESGPLLFGAGATLQNLGYLYRKRGMYTKAAMVLREALSVSLSLRFFAMERNLR
jgi:tetratricopeptide (TPR) repeat protein